MNCLNLPTVENVTDPTEAWFRVIHNAVYGYALPSICALGIVGNVLNFVILSRRKLRKSLRTLEQSANVCLVWLAVSDLCFCTTAFMTMFVPEDRVFFGRSFWMYYTAYHPAIINVFIMSSTWLTVTMAIERYIAVCHPFGSLVSMTLMRTKTIIALVYVASVLFNVPVVWRYQVSSVACANTTVFAVNIKPLPLAASSTADNIYRAFWAVTGNAIPLILLLYCNICLGCKIHSSYKMRKGFVSRRSSSKRTSETGSTLTVILVVIVVMFLILVAPSEIAMQVERVFDTKDSYTAQTIEVITNFTQTINFSVNFLLYIIISPYFRRTLRQMFCFLKPQRATCRSQRTPNGSLKNMTSYIL